VGDFPEHIGDMKLSSAQQPWLTPLGTGAPRLLTAGVTVRDQLGIDVLSADQGDHDRQPAAGRGAPGRGRRGPRPLQAVLGDGDQAQVAADALREHLAPDAVTPDTNQHVSDLVAETEVDTGASGDEHDARAVLTLADGRPAGFLSQALQRRALARSSRGRSGYVRARANDNGSPGRGPRPHGSVRVWR
jgi:hypothetical protein